MDNPVTILTFDTIIDAHIAKGRLQADGIECLLADEHLVQTDMLYSPAIGGIKLKVASRDQDRALSLLALDYSDELDAPADEDPANGDA